MLVKYSLSCILLGTLTIYGNQLPNRQSCFIRSIQFCTAPVHLCGYRPSRSMCAAAIAGTSGIVTMLTGAHQHDTSTVRAGGIVFITGVASIVLEYATCGRTEQEF